MAARESALRERIVLLEQLRISLQFRDCRPKFAATDRSVEALRIDPSISAVAQHLSERRTLHVRAVHEALDRSTLAGALGHLHGREVQSQARIALDLLIELRTTCFQELRTCKALSSAHVGRAALRN